MRSSKCVAVSIMLSLIVTILPTLGAGQDTATDTPPASAQVLSNTRTASCMVRITADADLISLNGETLAYLLYSPGVVDKAAQETLGIRSSEKRHTKDLLKIDVMRLEADRPAHRRSQMRIAPGYDEMMEAEMQAIYRQQYMEHSTEGTAKPEKEDDPKGNSTNGDSGSHQPSDEESMTGRSGGMDGFGDDMGMMGGQGMGGFGDGMGGMGGMGMMGGGMGGMYADTMEPGWAASRERTMTIKFSVHLPEDVRPAAQEFAMAIVENLRQALGKTCEQRRRELSALADTAQARWEWAQEQLAQVTGVRSAETIAVTERLDTIVDLSMLSPEMPFSEAVEVLRNSVEPRLQIAVMWKQLLANASVDPSDPIDLDPLPQVKVKTALEVLLQAVSSEVADLTYKIRDNVIVVATATAIETFEVPAAAAAAPAGEVDVRALVSQRQVLTREIRTLELDLAGLEARRRAIQKQIARTKDEAGRKLKDDTVTRELEKLVQMHIDTVSMLKKQAGDDWVSLTELAQANENLTRAKIELARRREELGKSAGGARLEGYNDELSQMAIDMAEKEARLDLLQRQLEDVRRQLSRARQFDPAAARARMATETLNLSERRVTELRQRLADLRPPTVTVLAVD